MAGRRSGKRTLTEVMDEDVSAKRRRSEEEDRSRRPRTPKVASKFFKSGPVSTQKAKTAVDDVSDTESVAGPSTLRMLREEKENQPCVDEDDSGEISEDGDPDPVTQEDGYMSPSPSCSKWDSPELSSPTRPKTYRAGEGFSDDDDCDAEILSSPPSAGRRTRTRETPRRSVGRVLVHGTPTRLDHPAEGADKSAPGPDLRGIFEDWGDYTSDIDDDEGDDDSMGSVVSSSGPVTPACSGQQPAGQRVEDILNEVTPDDEEIETQATAARNERVANGWWEKWARSGQAAAGRSSVRRDCCVVFDLPGRGH